MSTHIASGLHWVVIVDYYPARRFRRWGVSVTDDLHRGGNPGSRVSFYWTEHGATLRARREVEQIEHSIDGVVEVTP